MDNDSTTGDGRRSHLRIPRLEHLARWDTILAVLVVALLVVSTLTTDGFASGFNFSTSVAAMSEKALMVLPLVLLIVAREIDISVASIAGLSAATLGVVLRDGNSLPAAVVAALVVGIVCGAINGFFVAVLNLPSLVVTLGTLALFRGLCYVVLGDQPVSNIPAGLITLGNENINRTYLPLAIIPFILLAPTFAIVLHRTALGRRIYAIGGNPDTARYAGVRLTRTRFGLFTVSGLVCSVAGIINVGRTSQAVPDGLLGFELDAITIVFLGGVSVLGGKGRITGALWALILIISLRSVLQLQGQSGYTQGTAVGLLLIGSLLATSLVQRSSQALTSRRARRQARTGTATLGQPGT